MVLGLKLAKKKRVVFYFGTIQFMYKKIDIFY